MIITHPLQATNHKETHLDQAISDYLDAIHEIVSRVATPSQTLRDRVQKLRNMSENKQKNPAAQSLTSEGYSEARSSVRLTTQLRQRYFDTGEVYCAP